MSVNRSNPDQYQLRFPPGLRDRIKDAAERNNRSMNAEIIAALMDKFPDPEFLEDLRLADEIDELQQRFDRLRLLAKEIEQGKGGPKSAGGSDFEADSGPKNPKA